MAGSLEEAAEGAEHVQESGPEEVEWKRRTFAQLEALTGPGTVLATSSSFITSSEISRDNLEQGRMLVGHPFNPVLVLPLVEVVGGSNTHPETVEAAVETYRAVGKHPVVVGAEVQGFIGNRLQFVLLAEALHLVEQGVATPEEIAGTVRSEFLPPQAVVTDMFSGKALAHVDDLHSFPVEMPPHHGMSLLVEAPPPPDDEVALHS